MAESDAQQQEAAQAELAARMAALHDHVKFLLENDPAALIMAIPELFGASLVEMVAAGVQMGMTRAMEQLAQAEQAKTEQAAAPHKPILWANTGNVHLAAQAAMAGMPPPGAPGA